MQSSCGPPVITYRIFEQYRNLGRIILFSRFSVSLSFANNSTNLVNYSPNIFTKTISYS